MADFVPMFKGLIVLEVGNAWEPRPPVMSTLSLKALFAFHDRGVQSPGAKVSSAAKRRFRIRVPYWQARQGWGHFFVPKGIEFDLLSDYQGVMFIGTTKTASGHLRRPKN